MRGIRFASASLLAVSVTTMAHAQAAAGGGTPGPAAVAEANGASLTGPPADAAPAGSEIVVVAQKRAQKLSDVPMSITAVTGDTLKSRGITNVQDLVKLTPGLSYAEAGNGVPVYSLRGIGFFDTSLGARPTVSVYSDEAPIPFAVETTGASFDLDHVEVLKGPQGTLFGQNSTGGAINYISAKPQDRFGAGATVSYDNFATADWQGYITGPVTSTLDARLAVRTVQGGPWQKSYTRDDRLGDRDFTQGRLLLDWRPSDRLKISLNGNGFVDHGQTQAGQDIAVIPQVAPAAAFITSLTNYPHAPADDRAADWDAGQPLRRHNDYYQAILRGDYKLTDRVTVTSLTSYSHMKIDQQVDIDGTALTNALEQVTGNLSSLATELRMTAHLGKATIIAGGNYSHDRTNESDFYSIPFSTLSRSTLRADPTGPLDAMNPFGHQIFNIKAVFGNADYNLNRLVTLHGGIRYTQADLDYRACNRVGDVSTGAGLAAVYNTAAARRGLPPLGPIAPGQCLSVDTTVTPALGVGSLDQHNVSWRAGFDVKPAPRTLLYFNVSRGYKAGSIPVTATLANSQAAPVSQESVLAYEAGFKLSAFDRKADLSGAIFDYQYSDKQVKSRVVVPYFTLFGNLETLVNIPKSRVRGAEGQISVYPIRGLTFTAAGTYISSKVLGAFSGVTILGNPKSFSGDPFPYTPKWQATLDGQYKVPISERLDATFEAGYNYRSRTTAGFGDEPVLKIDGYGLLDLQAGIERKDAGWRVSLFGRNVTDKYYWTNVAKFFDVARRLAGLPATYGVQFGVKF